MFKRVGLRNTRASWRSKSPNNRRYSHLELLADVPPLAHSLFRLRHHRHSYHKHHFLPPPQPSRPQKANPRNPHLLSNPRVHSRRAPSLPSSLRQSLRGRSHAYLPRRPRRAAARSTSRRALDLRNILSSRHRHRRSPSRHPS